MLSAITGSGMMAGGGIATIESRIQQIEGMINAIETRRNEALTQPNKAAPSAGKADVLESPKPFQFFLKKTGNAADSPNVLAPDTLQTDSPISTRLPRAEQLQPLVESISRKHNVDKDLVNAVIMQESGFNPNAVSKAGATGLMQLMPGTAQHLGIQNSKDPAQNLDGGVRYLKGLLDQFNGNIPLALAAYNAGPGAVSRHKGIPPYKETQNYVRTILSQFLKAKQGQQTG
jgi:soluble lytic murein transglycosylase-like protein